MTLAEHIYVMVLENYLSDAPALPTDEELETMTQFSLRAEAAMEAHTLQGQGDD